MSKTSGSEAQKKASTDGSRGRENGCCELIEGSSLIEIEDWITATANLGL